MEELPEIVAVITVKTVFGAYPYKTGHILTDSLELVVRKLAE